METQNSRNNSENKRGQIIGGLIIVVVGSIFLLRNLDLGLMIPNWITSWPMILIGAGLFIGVRHSFKNPVWIVPVILGSVFLVAREFDIHFGQLWPLILICIGIGIMIKPKRVGRANDFWQTDTTSSEEIMDTTSIFGNIKKNVITKDFKVGDVTAIFGGTELNFSRADINGKAVLDITMIFAGTKLIVPPHWKIETSDIVTIFGGVEDKRPLPQGEEATDKVLVLKGTCLFGGIDIKSY